MQLRKTFSNITNPVHSAFFILMELSCMESEE